MKKRIINLFTLLLFTLITNSQTATFITLDDVGNLYKVSVGNTGNCTSTSLNLCNNFTGNPLSIALDGNKLYIVDNQGFLYKSTLTNSGTANNCTKIGTFPTPNLINGLTVGNGGIVYAASGSKIQTYNPTNNSFATLGSIPSQWTIGGDLLFYQGQLYMACKINGSNTNNALIQVNLTNPSASTLYMNFNAGTNAFGFASVTVPCSNNQAYALSNGTTTTKIYAIDMVAKTEATTATCTLNYNVYDATSIAETQSAIPPTEPTVTSPINFCQFQTTTTLNVSTAAPDTLRWYSQAIGGSAYGSPTPALSTNTIGTTHYFVSNFDTSTGCESGRSEIVVTVNPYPAVPTINPSGTNTICVGNVLPLTSSSTTNNQWYLNGSIINTANQQTYSANANGDYTVTVTGAGGCSKTSLPTTLNITDASISYSGNPFCNIGTKAVTLIGLTGGTFSSTPSGLSINNTTGTIDLANSALGNYTIIYTAGPANCTFTTSIKVEHPTASISYSANTYCKASAAQSVITTGTTGGTFSSSPTGLTIDASGTITPASSIAGTYTVTYTFGTVGVGCGLLTTSTIVTINAPVNTTINASTCAGVPYNFNGNNYSVAGTYSASFTSAAGCDSIVTLNLSIKPKTISTTNATICSGDNYVFAGTTYTAAGTYNATLTNAEGCDSIATLNLSTESFKITLVENPNPVSAGANFTAQLNSSATIANSLWQPTGLFTNNQSSQSITAPNSSFTIKVLATSTNGCKDSIDRPVTVFSNFNLYVPNTFMPSKMGNDNISTLKVYGTGIKSSQMVIFNQWGEKLFETTNPTVIGWNGTVYGKLQPTGVYIYSVKVTYQNNTTTTKSGTVNLIR